MMAMFLFFRHEAGERRERDVEEVQHGAGAERTVAEGVDHRADRSQQDEEHGRRKDEERNRFRRKVLALLEAHVPGHRTPLAGDRPQQEDDDHHHRTESDDPVLHQELEMVVVDIRPADTLELLERNIELLHLVRAEMGVPPSPDAEERMIPPDRSRNLGMILSLPCHAV